MPAYGRDGFCNAKTRLVLLCLCQSETEASDFALITNDRMQLLAKMFTLFLMLMVVLGEAK